MSDEHLVLTPPAKATRIAVPTWAFYVVVWMLGLAISSFVGYAAASSSMNARVSVLEAQKQDIERRLTSIEHKLDEVLERTAR